MSYIKGDNRNQTSAFPFTLEEFITEDNPVRVIDLFINTLDLNTLQFIPTGSSKEGRPAFEPKILLKLYLYGYLNRIRTSRILERECERNIELMWLLGNLKPCFRTIAGFRSDNKKALKNLFKHFVLMLRNWNVIGGDTVAIDSSKFRAVNSKKNNFNPAKIERQLKYINDKVETYLKEMEQADAAEDKEYGDTVNANIITQLSRKIKYNELKEKLKQTGEEQVSTTDADARSMILHGNANEVAFNIQTAVDDKHNLVVYYDTTNKNDRKALTAVAIQTKHVLQKGEITVLADKGYHNAEQIQTCTDHNIVTYVATPDAPHNSEVPAPDYYGEKFIYHEQTDTYTCPQNHTLSTNKNWYDKTHLRYSNKVKHYKTSACKNCPVKQMCTRNKNGRLIERSEYAQAVEENNSRIKNEKQKYLQRQCIIEHVFGTIKRQWGYDHILLKGLEKNNGEFGLIYLCYNFKRIINILGINEVKKRIKEMLFHFLILLHPILNIRKSKKVDSYCPLYIVVH